LGNLKQARRGKIQEPEKTGLVQAVNVIKKPKFNSEEEKRQKHGGRLSTEQEVRLSEFLGPPKSPGNLKAKVPKARGKHSKK